ncbi:MAG: hypothetical protein J1F40_10750 [Prevotellaceae bacterium]|nr:hypothetical protein [Prevotellaceae bacterium]
MNPKQKEVIESVVECYNDLCHLSAMKEGLQNVYDEYKSANDPDTLRWLLALCIRIHHGRRMPWVSCYLAVEALMASECLGKSFEDFESLHSEVSTSFKDISFARGPLTCYDTAVNVAFLLSDTLLPQKYVYLHAGAWKGAGYLMDECRLRSVMPVAEWHEFFPDMESWKIEDMLCIYKDVFKKLKENECVTKSDISPSSGGCSSPAPKKCCTDATLFKGRYTKEYVLRRLQEAEENLKSQKQ